jgi:hypothetical protein
MPARFSAIERGCRPPAFSRHGLELGEVLPDLIIVRSHGKLQQGGRFLLSGGVRLEVSSWLPASKRLMVGIRVEAHQSDAADSITDMA